MQTRRCPSFPLPSTTRPMLAAVRRRLFPLRPGALTAAFSTATATPTPTPSADSTVSYLISRCGLSPTAAAHAAPSLRLASPHATAQADAVLALLRRYGFSEADISSAVCQVPALLAINPAKTLQPKLDFFTSVGIDAPLLRQLILINPIILRRSVQNHLEPLFAALREVLGSDARVVAAFKKEPFAMRCLPKSTFFLTLPLLRDHGLSAVDVSKLVALKPGIILLRPDRINEIVEAARRIGVRPGNSMFVCIFGILSVLKVSTLKSKVALYRRLGFQEDAVTLMIRRYPSSVAISEKKIAENVVFLTDKVGLTYADIVTYPTMLARSLETLSRRCAVLAVLRRAGKQPERRLPMLLVWTEKRFREEYVKRYMKEVPDVVQAMNGEIPFQGFDLLEEKPKVPRKKMSV